MAKRECLVVHHAWSVSCLLQDTKHYTQRKLLRKMIEDADSIIRTDRRGAHLRFKHETVILPLVCLLGLNGFDFVTDDLEQLEFQRVVG